MDPTASAASDPVLANLASLLPTLKETYTDIHRHPELSMQETRTAGLAAERLRATGYEVTSRAGNSGVVGVLRNGEGPTVMRRADMDALRARAAPELPYEDPTTAPAEAGV